MITYEGPFALGEDIADVIERAAEVALVAKCLNIQGWYTLVAPSQAGYPKPQGLRYVQSTWWTHAPRTARLQDYTRYLAAEKIEIPKSAHFVQARGTEAIKFFFNGTWVHAKVPKRRGDGHAAFLIKMREALRADWEHKQVVHGPRERCSGCGRSPCTATYLACTDYAARHLSHVPWQDQNRVCLDLNASHAHERKRQDVPEDPPWPDPVSDLGAPNEPKLWWKR